jgi:hypothetical protein
MAFNQELFQTLVSNGVPAEAAVKAATTPDAAPAQAAAPVPQTTFQPPANTIQPQAAQPVTPPAKGSLAQAYAQGAKTGGYGPSIKFKEVGARIDGTVARDMTDLDVTQETDYATKAPKFEKDGVTPKWQMTIPLDLAPSGDYPEGKGIVWAKGGLLKAVVRGMVSAGYDVNNNEAFRQGDVVSIVRIPDRPTNYGNAAHEFEVTVTRAGQQVAQAVVPATAVAESVPTVPAATPSAPAAPTQPVQAPVGADGLTDEQRDLIAQYAGK